MTDRTEMKTKERNGRHGEILKRERKKGKGENYASLWKQR
jgi:hypothetical protein